MRPRYSITGPLILIAVGVLFLLHTVSPQFQIVELFAHYWPYFLILWGVLELLEIAVWAARRSPGIPGGIGAGGWLLVLLICLLGVGSFELNRPGNWWRAVGLENGMEVFGNAHDYSITPMQRTTVAAPRIVIERFRGDARITGVPGNLLSLTGHKTVRALDLSTADRTNVQTPVEIINNGKTIVIRCHQDRAASGHQLVTTDLDLTVPVGASVEITGTKGEFEVSALDGDVEVSGDRAAVRAHDLRGSVHVDTGRSDEIACSNIGGTVSLHGHGTDVELSRIKGEVTVDGDYSGVVTLEDIAKPVHMDSSRTKLTVQRVNGQMKLARGSLDAHGVTGPITVSTRATDVSLDSFSDGLDLTVDKGDIDLKPGLLSVGKVVVRTNSGDIDFAVPATNFILTASTEHGSIDNQLGDEFAEEEHGGGARLTGGHGAGPDLNLTTAHGNITLHRVDQHQGSKPETEHTPAKAAPGQVAQAEE